MWTGSWWRPDRWRTEEVGGELTASDRGNTLVLFGTFAEWDCGKDGRRVVTFPMAEPLREPMVHGFAGGTEFTLLNAECSFPRPPTGYGTEQWRAEAALEGHLVPSADGSLPLFRALRVSLQHLPVWAPRKMSISGSTSIGGGLRSESSRIPSLQPFFPPARRSLSNKESARITRAQSLRSHNPSR